MRTAAVSLLICVAAAALEGVAAGRGVKRRFSELKLPRLSPPFGLWVLIGLVYYVTCWLILTRLIGPAPGSFVAFVPDVGLVLILAAALLRADRTAAAILFPYLCYATWWVYRVWRLNVAQRSTGE